MQGSGICKQRTWASAGGACRGSGGPGHPAPRTLQGNGAVGSSTRRQPACCRVCQPSKTRRCAGSLVSLPPVLCARRTIKQRVGGGWPRADGAQQPHDTAVWGEGRRGRHPHACRLLGAAAAWAAGAAAARRPCAAGAASPIRLQVAFLWRQRCGFEGTGQNSSACRRLLLLCSGGVGSR